MQLRVGGEDRWVATPRVEVTGKASFERDFLAVSLDTAEVLARSYLAASLGIHPDDLSSDDVDDDGNPLELGLEILQYEVETYEKPTRS